MGSPPRLAATWAIADLRRYGPADGKYVLEGGSRCGRAEGLHVLGVTGGQADVIHTAVEEAAQCRLQARRRLARKQDESPSGLSRRTVSRSCSRDSTITRSRESGLCRQSSLQWSACSSDDCDLSDPAAVASGDVITRPCGDGQSEFSAGSSGSDSAAGRRASAGSGGGSGFGSGVCGRSASGSGSGMRSPRAVRRCSADCACAVKISRSSLRRTGVLDGVGEEPRNAATPISPPPGPRFVDHVYEEPGEKPINGVVTSHRPITIQDTPHRPINAPHTSHSRPITDCGSSGRLVRTVAEVHDLDPALGGYDRPRPALPTTPGAGATRLSPEGISEHLYEDPGPAEGWYQTPRPCNVCQKRCTESRQADDGLYKIPACPCASCGGHGQAASGVLKPGSGGQQTSVALKPRVDGSGRMPVMNADTGEIEIPAPGDQLCPQIPSEQILDTGLYSQPTRPAYAVVDKSKRTYPLLPGLAPPPLPAAAPATEPSYANVAPPDGGPAYANCAPVNIGGGVVGSADIGGSTSTSCPPPLSKSTSATNIVATKDDATYVNCSPIQVQTSTSATNGATYVNCSPVSQPHHHHQQPLYANEPTTSLPPNNYLPMRPPCGPNRPTLGDDYLDMSGRPGRPAMRRSHSAECGQKMALRSASLGRRPMPSPKPERLRHLVVARGPGPVMEGRSSTLPGDSCSGVTSLVDSPVTSLAAGSTSPAIPPLQLSSSEAGLDDSQSQLSARSASSSSPRVALLSQKPRSGTEYQCLDRGRLLAQMSEPGPEGRSSRGCSVDI
ncbi:uncharacterized protein LOC122376291 [Amphibalanus amphitrite]|uniref:uncharacterized protein LOC122376291 n=1 Tax=Amphibalanus amphitrite TaxID=1232801 RepID=UPI001C906965|nr:uncharacterized protein LOC122376291 [Amphibalanus amphitrite]